MVSVMQWSTIDIFTWGHQSFFLEVFAFEALGYRIVRPIKPMCRFAFFLGWPFMAVAVFKR